MSATSIFKAMKPNSLDFPLVNDVVKDTDKICPKCKSRLKTVLRTTLGAEGGVVECYSCRAAFAWIRVPVPA